MKEHGLIQLESPSVFPLMLQRWHEIAFFHWSAEPSLVQQRLPAGLTADIINGQAWISVTPFLLTGLRPPLCPRALSLTFPEMNLRTYVVGPSGPGIWFFSLDAARFYAVLGARAMFGLPYFWAKMVVGTNPTENFYFSKRSNGAQARIRIAKEARIAEQSELDTFLTARFRLYSIYSRRLITAEVEHPPWQLNQVRILELDENVRRTMDVEFPSRDFLAHWSSGVDTRIGFPKRAIA
jgi:uncharacterized protein